MDNEWKDEDDDNPSFSRFHRHDRYSGIVTKTKPTLDKETPPRNEQEERFIPEKHEDTIWDETSDQDDIHNDLGWHPRRATPISLLQHNRAHLHVPLTLNLFTCVNHAHGSHEKVWVEFASRAPPSVVCHRQTHGIGGEWLAADRFYLHFGASSHVPVSSLFSATTTASTGGSRKQQQETKTKQIQESRDQKERGKRSQVQQKQSANWSQKDKGSTHGVVSCGYAITPNFGVSCGCEMEGGLGDGTRAFVTIKEVDPKSHSSTQLQIYSRPKRRLQPTPRVFPSPPPPSPSSPGAIPLINVHPNPTQHPPFRIKKDMEEEDSIDACLQTFTHLVPNLYKFRLKCGLAAPRLEEPNHHLDDETKKNTTKETSWRKVCKGLQVSLIRHDTRPTGSDHKVLSSSTSALLTWPEWAGVTWSMGQWGRFARVHSPAAAAADLEQPQHTKQMTEEVPKQDSSSLSLSSKPAQACLDVSMQHTLSKWHIGHLHGRWYHLFVWPFQATTTTTCLLETEGRITTLLSTVSKWSVGLRHLWPLGGWWSPQKNTCCWSSSWGSLALVCKYQRGSFVLDVPVTLLPFAGGTKLVPMDWWYPIKTLYVSFVAFTVHCAATDVALRWSGHDAGNVHDGTRGVEAKTSDKAVDEDAFHDNFATARANHSQAAKQRALMSRAAMACRRTEREKTLRGEKGLVILEAKYGFVESCMSMDDEREDTSGGAMQENEGKEKVDLTCVDVTVPLQFWVSDSRLSLPRGSKRGMLGFCPVYGNSKTLATPSNGCEGEEQVNFVWSALSWVSRLVFNNGQHCRGSSQMKDTERSNVEPVVLKVRYQYGMKVFQLTVKDEKPLTLPHLDG